MTNSNGKAPRTPITLEEVQAHFELRDGLLYRKGSDIPVRENLRNTHAYQRVTLASGKRVRIHRVVFLLSNKWLPFIVDHKDQRKHNNHASNLRPASYRENRRNSAVKASSGYLGVDWKNGKWRARLTDRTGKQRLLGYFQDILDAAAAVNEAAERFELDEFVPLNPIPEYRKQA